MITLNVFFHIQPSKKDDFLKVLNNMVSESNKEDGCQFYQLWQNNENSNNYALIELWQDKFFLAKHQKTAHWITFNNVVNTYLSEPYDEHHYQEIER